MTDEENKDGVGSEDNSDSTGENQDNQSGSTIDNLDPEIQKRDAQIAHWRDKANKLAGEVKTLRPKENPQPKEGEQKAYDPFEAVKLGKVLKDFDEAETDFILRNARSKSIEDIQAAAKDDMVQSAIMSRREKVAKESKVPSPSSSGSSGFSEKSPSDIEKMSREEHKEYVKEVEKRAMSNEGV